MVNPSLWIGALAWLAGAQPYLAWWVTAEVEPRDIVVADLPIQDVDPAWCRATLLDESMVPPEGRVEGESPESHSAVFALNTDLDRDGVNERLTVGVHLRCDGVKGRFLLIQKKQGAVWVKAAVFTVEGRAAFSFIQRDDTNVLWATCLECDGVCTIRVHAGRYSLDCEDSDASL